MLTLYILNANNLSCCGMNLNKKKKLLTAMLRKLQTYNKKLKVFQIHFLQ